MNNDSNLNIITTVHRIDLWVGKICYFVRLKANFCVDKLKPVSVDFHNVADVKCGL